MKHVFGDGVTINQGLAIAIGKFDGLHKGHLALISKLKEVAEAQGLASAVLSFSPHPAAVLGGVDVPLILSPSEKLHLLSQLGLDYFIEYPFTHDFAQISPNDFLKDIVVELLRGKALVVGENFRFGHKGAGNVALAKGLGDVLSLQVHTMPLVTQDVAEISANSIRDAVAKADFRAVKDMCGREYFIMGEALHIPHENKLLPPYGVYDTRTHLDGKTYKSVTTISRDAVKTDLIDFMGDLVGRILCIDFLAI